METVEICPSCGSPLRSGARFCTKCGRQQEDETGAAEQLKTLLQPEQGTKAPPPAPIIAPVQESVQTEKSPKKKATQYAVTIKKRRELFIGDRYVPEGSPAPRRARMGAFIFDIFVLNIYVQALLWFILILPILAEVRAYLSTAGGMPIASPTAKIVTFIVAFLMFIVFYGVIPLGSSGRTLGKYIAGIAVYTKNGDPLNLQRTFTRCFAYLFSALPLGIGFLVALLPTNRETWHDRISSTRVMHTQKVGTVKQMFLVAAPVLLVICTAVSAVYFRKVVNEFEFRGTVSLATPNSTADVLCRTQANLFYNLFLLPAEQRKGLKGWETFAAFYGMMRQQLPDGNAIAVAQSRTLCRVEGIREVAKGRSKVSLVVEQRTPQADGSQPAPQRISFMLVKIGKEWLPGVIPTTQPGGVAGAKKPVAK